MALRVRRGEWGLGLGGRWLGAIGVVACAGLGAGCASATTVPSVPAVAYGSRYLEAPASCAPDLPDGVLAPALTPRDTVVAGSVCGQDPSSPGGAVARALSRAQVTRLAQALELPSAAQRPVCDASGAALPAFLVQLADGRWVHPDLPSDGCHPRTDVTRALVELSR